MAAVGNEGAHKAGLAAHAGSRLVADGILVVKTFGLVRQNKRSAPPKAVAGGQGHANRLARGQQMTSHFKMFAPLRAVGYEKGDFHLD